MTSESQTGPTDRVLEQAKALVRAIEAVETMRATGPIGRVQAWFLLKAGRRRLRAIVELLPNWLVEDILSAGEHIDEGRPALWLSEN